RRQVRLALDVTGRDGIRILDVQQRIAVATAQHQEGDDQEPTPEKERYTSATTPAAQSVVSTHGGHHQKLTLSRAVQYRIGGCVWNSVVVQLSAPAKFDSGSRPV